MGELAKIFSSAPSLPSESEKENWYEGETIKYFSMAEADKLLALASGWYQLVYLLLFETGCRIEEAREIRVRDIDFQTNKVRVVTLKQRKSASRVLVISDRLKSLILMHRLDKQLFPTDYILANGPGESSISRQVVRQTMGRHCRELGIEMDKAKPHTWRHTRAIQLLESGELDVIRLKDFLGHCSLSSTLVYVKFSNRQVTEAVQRANLKLGLR